jgi:hypothetical protein
MSGAILLVGFIIAVALAFDYINGFHDAANSIATVVSTRVLTPGRAVVWAAAFNFLAAILDQRTGDDRPKSFDGERSVDWQTRDSGFCLRVDVVGQTGKRLFQFWYTLTSSGTDGDDRRSFEERAVNEVFGLGSRKLEQFLVNEIGFCKYDQTRLNVKQSTDIEVFARLRHHGFVGRNDEHDQIDPVSTGEHVLDEALVPWNIDEAKLKVADHQIRKSDVDSDASLLFFFEAVGVDTGERLDQRGLAVVNVACGSYDDRFHVVNSIAVHFGGSQLDCCSNLA